MLHALLLVILLLPSVAIYCSPCWRVIGTEPDLLALHAKLPVIMVQLTNRIRVFLLNFDSRMPRRRESMLALPMYLVELFTINVLLIQHSINLHSILYAIMRWVFEIMKRRQVIKIETVRKDDHGRKDALKVDGWI